MKFWFVLVLGALALTLGAVGAQAAGLELPIEGGTAVWIQPLDGSAGSMGAALSLTLPEKYVGEVVSGLIRLDVIVHPEGGQVRVDPGLSISLETDVGIPVKVGIVALPLTDYKVGWFVGATIFQTSV